MFVNTQYDKTMLTPCIEEDYLNRYVHSRLSVHARVRFYHDNVKMKTMRRTLPWSTQAFRHFDTRRKGKLTEADLSDGLRRLGMELTTEQERALFSAMGEEMPPRRCSGLRRTHSP